MAQALVRRAGEWTESTDALTLLIRHADPYTSFRVLHSLTEETRTRSLREVSADFVIYGATDIFFAKRRVDNLASIKHCEALLPKACVLVVFANHWNLTQIMDRDWCATGHADQSGDSGIMAVDDTLVRLERVRMPEVKARADPSWLNSPL